MQINGDITIFVIELQCYVVHMVTVLDILLLLQIFKIENFLLNVKHVVIRK